MDDNYAHAQILEGTMARKISVITLHNIKNYGSALQTYATQFVMESLGFSAEFVDYFRKDVGDANLLLNNALQQTTKWNRNPLMRYVFKIVKKPTFEKLVAVFDRFQKKYIHKTPSAYYSFEELCSDPPKADVYCTGSDQVWNSLWNRGIEKAYFLEYAPVGAPRISFAASIGKNKLDDWEIDETRDMLSKYDAISVREQRAVEILNDIGISGAVHVLDPTLMLTKKDWLKLACSRIIAKPYLLLYQLNDNAEMDDYAEKMAKKFHLKLIRLTLGYDNFLKSGKCICLPEVEGFLSLFIYADYVVTDSFHGTAFSLNLNKPLSVFYPDRFSSRLQSILDLTGQLDRVVTDSKDLALFKKPIGFDRVNEILAQEREKTQQFLQKALFQTVPED